LRVLRESWFAARDRTEPWSVRDSPLRSVATVRRVCRSARTAGLVAIGICNSSALTQPLLAGRETGSIPIEPLANRLSC
jgi:hypothetical protein